MIWRSDHGSACLGLWFAGAPERGGRSGGLPAGRAGRQHRGDPVGLAGSIAAARHHRLLAVPARCRLRRPQPEPSVAPHREAL